MNTKFVAVVNQKGGVGKTTTAVNFAAIATRILGSGKVLLIDTDPQSNSTTSFLPHELAFGDRNADTKTLLDVLEDRISLAEAVHHVSLPSVDKQPAVTLHIVPARIELSALESQLNNFQYVFTLQKKAEVVRGQYALVIIDTPPNIGGYMLNALMLANYLLVPVTPGQHEVAGLRSLLDTIEPVKRINNHLEIAGVLPTRVKRTNLARDVIEGLKDFFGPDKLLPSIADRVAIERAHTQSCDIFTYAPKSDSAKQYWEATMEFLQRIGLGANGHE